MNTSDKTEHATKDKLNKKGQKPSQSKTLEGHFDREAGFLTSIFINSPIGIYVVQNGKFCFANPMLQKITGYKEDELLGMESMRLVFTKDWSKVREYAVKMLKLKSNTPYEYRAINKEGTIKWAIETVTSIQYEGKPATLGYFMDITRRKQAEEALGKAYEDLQREMEERKRLEKALMQEEKLKTLGSIAAEVAHEIRNPLVSIGGFAQRLKQKFPDLSECDIILSESKRLEKILSRIRDYLEPVEIHPKECSVNTIIADCLNLLSPETKTRQVKCVSDLASRLPSAYVDPEILSQICINLIRNATEAMADGGALFIKSFEKDQELHIEFNNKATGLKVRYSETLFMPFAEGGQSFGLPLCYRLLKDMGGLLSYTHDNDYITVTVSLPKIVGPRSEKRNYRQNRTDITAKSIYHSQFQHFIGTSLKPLLVLINLTVFTFLICAPLQHTTDEPGFPPPGKTGFETYLGIQDILENSGDLIDYDTLMLVYTSIAHSKHPIPHIDQLLKSLINKRNNNPRIDQMILIFSALTIGDSKFPIPNVYEIFESILKKNSRVNEWVISFVAASIGKYPFDIPDGDSLVDLLEERLDQVTAMNTSVSKESFGFHFIPPPQSDYIISYIRGIQEQRAREIERASYYSLIQNGFSEAEIESALMRVQRHGISGTGEKYPLPMKYIRFNVNSVF